jgi:subtilisin family serine protease
MLLFAALSLARADDTFWIGEAPVRYGELVAQGVVEGRTGRLLVRGDAAAVAAHPGVRRVTPLPGGLLRVEPVGDDLALARALRGWPGVRRAEPDLLFATRPASVPDDPLVADQWHLENTGQGGRTADVDIDAALAWTFATGAGQRIAILDSGTQLDHPDLAVIPGHDYVDRDEVPDPGSDTSNAHGTGTAGIAAAIGGNGLGGAGVAYDAEVYAIRLIGGATSTEDLYNAFIEAVDAGSTVLSNSWGFGYDCSGVPTLSVFDDMFDYAEDEGRGGLGAAVVFAAGNAGCDIDTDGMLRSRSIVVVAALESSDVRASYSNYGEVVDIAAPTSLLTADVFPGGYGAYGGDDAYFDGFSGTSGATPVVAGVLALMFEANPRLTAKQARTVLCDTATRVDVLDAAYDANGRSDYYGCGRVDAGAAVAAVANTAPEAPVPRLVAETAESPNVRAAWEPAFDPDGDVHAYRLRWTTVRGSGETVTGEAEVAATWHDLSDAADVGDRVTWTVAAVDAWGEGPSSQPVTFDVVPVSETIVPSDDEAPTDTSPDGEVSGGGGCASVPGARGGLLAAGLSGLLAALRRRRIRPAACGHAPLHAPARTPPTGSTAARRP